MTWTLDLPEDAMARLVAEAARRGTTAEDVLTELLIEMAAQLPAAMVVEGLDDEHRSVEE